MRRSTFHLANFSSITYWKLLTRATGSVVQVVQRQIHTITLGTSFSPLFWPWTTSRVALATIFQNVIQEKLKKKLKKAKIQKKKYVVPEEKYRNSLSTIKETSICNFKVIALLPSL